mgnify:CR=1 FL=1
MEDLVLRLALELFFALVLVLVVMQVALVEEQLGVFQPMKATSAFDLAFALLLFSSNEYQVTREPDLFLHCFLQALPLSF